MSSKSIYERYTGGPHGVGDPDDTFLRKVELEVLIPKKMREKARVEKCFKEAEEFSACAKQAGLLLPFKCRDENSTLKDCLIKWYRDETFKAQCTEEYLKERAEFRRTGITVKQKRINS